MVLRRHLLAAACLAAVSALGSGCSTLEADSAAQARVSAVPPEQRRIEPLLEEAVLAAVGRAVPVRCWTRSEWTGVLAQSRAPIGRTDPANVLGVAVDDGAGRIELSPRTCEPLAALVASGRLPRDRTAAVDLVQALVTVGHEAGHLVAGLDSEAEAECFGAQHVPAVAQTLGLTQAQGDLLARFYWSEVYPKTDPIYRSPECRDGGALDLDQRSSAWP